MTFNSAGELVVFAGNGHIPAHIVSGASSKVFSGTTTDPIHDPLVRLIRLVHSRARRLTPDTCEEALFMMCVLARICASEAIDIFSATGAVDVITDMASAHSEREAVAFYALDSLGAVLSKCGTHVLDLGNWNVSF